MPATLGVISPPKLYGRGIDLPTPMVSLFSINTIFPLIDNAYYWVWGYDIFVYWSGGLLPPDLNFRVGGTPNLSFTYYTSGSKILNSINEFLWGPSYAPYAPADGYFFRSGNSVGIRQNKSGAPGTYFTVSIESRSMGASLVGYAEQF
jgi:hypothetical protein